MSIPTNKQLKQVRYNGAVIPLVNPSAGTLQITTNGEHNVTQYATVNVNVQGGITPTGTLNINANGDYDVSSYASAHVNVEAQSDVIGGTLIPSTTADATTITIQTSKKCSFVAVFLVDASSENNGNCGSLCVQEGHEGAGSLNRWRASYGQGYAFSDVASVTFGNSSITLTCTNYPFASNRTYRWIAY